MEAQLPKYRFCIQRHNEELPSWMEKINALAEVGYRIHSIDLDRCVATMSLKSTPDIQNAEDFVNLNIGDPKINELIQVEGWIPIANYSKHVTLMRKKDGGAGEGTFE